VRRRDDGGQFEALARGGARAGAQRLRRLRNSLDGGERHDVWAYHGVRQLIPQRGPAMWPGPSSCRARPDDAGDRSRRRTAVQVDPERHWGRPWARARGRGPASTVGAAGRRDSGHDRDLVSRPNPAATMPATDLRRPGRVRRLPGVLGEQRVAHETAEQGAEVTQHHRVYDRCSNSPGCAGRFRTRPLPRAPAGRAVGGRLTTC
jgi:hypothetical protein